ncbi:cytochrome C oxidase subunit IV family protein [Persicitalea sp.]|uniref:cytochrome C oxidase subunit IV family protein n=1 Tax=Persicitalea sp. TaxID=3100273 RepID=UPI0035943AF6
MAEIHATPQEVAARHDDVPTDGGAAQRKQIWKVFIILSVITAFEFLIAFTMHASTLKVAIFVGLTIVKAFYIVGEFMHLKHEVKSLIWSILIPVIFVVWLLLALMLEGGSIFELR